VLGCFGAWVPVRGCLGYRVLWFTDTDEETEPHPDHNPNPNPNPNPKPNPNPNPNPNPKNDPKNKNYGQTRPKPNHHAPPRFQTPPTNNLAPRTYRPHKKNKTNNPDR
jgi:hypothetical protein